MVDWEVFLDLTQQLNDQFHENGRAMSAGELTLQQFRDRGDQLMTKALPNGRLVSLNHFNRFPAQQFSNFVHGPQAKGRMLAESLAVDTWCRQSSLSSVSLVRDRTNKLDEIAIGLEIYKTKHSDYPVRLEALVPEILPAIPVDPTTLIDFFYATTKTDFKLYAFGRDGIDDGGDEESDVVFKRPLKDMREYLIGVE